MRYSPQATGTLRRPPMVNTGSSSSSLSGMEQAVPSFQSFIKRTAPLSEQKPLPPTPLIPRRASSNSPPRSRSRSSYASRRSSSVYSRTVSQWGADDAFWGRAAFADEPLPPVPILQPLAYSASTPQLVARQPTPPPLLPRRYSPIINSPSPTESRATTPSPAPKHELSVLLPTPPVAAPVPKQHLRTVSLEKAKAAAHAPGAVHLLPEELRAQRFGRSSLEKPKIELHPPGAMLSLPEESRAPTVGKSRSHEPLRVDSFDIIAGNTPPELSRPPTLVDHHSRQRTIQSPIETHPTATEYPFPIVSTNTKYQKRSFKVDKGPERLMIPLASQQRQASRDKVVQALGINVEDEPRGRTRQRGPRKMDYSHYLPKNNRVSKSSSSEEETDAQKVAKEYHNLLTDQYRKPASSPAYHGTDSDDSIKNHMKMIPRPLFQTKPPAKLPGSIAERKDETSVSPHNQRYGNGLGEAVRRRSSGSSKRSFPFQLSLTPDSAHRRSSTSGSIPISPPSQASPMPTAKSEERPPPTRKKAPRRRRKNNDPRVSAYYPHVTSRKSNTTKRKQSDDTSETPPVPLLAADIIAERSEASREPSDISPFRRSQSSSLGRKNSPRRRSDTSSEKAPQPLYQRVAKGAAKYADLLTKPSEPPERRNYQPITTATVAPGSPHLLPSPVKSQQKKVHLGWSDTAKAKFDETHSPVQSPTRLFALPETSKAPQFTHFAMPARPLDESKAGLTESPRRKGSIFSGMLDGWKESKAERRREELKKIIKVVPPESGNGAAMKRRSSTFAWM